MRIHRPLMVILVEPKISGALADNICRRLGKNHWIRSEARGFSGGVWCLWDEEVVDVTFRDVHTSFVHLSVRTRGGKKWELSAVYASPNANIRRHLWSCLDGLNITDPWMLIGDFNCVLRSDERSSLRGESSNFKDWVDRKGLVDMGYVGTKFTWSYGLTENTRRAA